MLIEALAAAFDPNEYRDRYRQNLRALIDAKIQDQPVDAGTPAPLRRPVVDILKVLQDSLALAKKPLSAGHGFPAGANGIDTEIRRRPRKRA